MQYPQSLAVLLILIMAPCWMGMQLHPTDTDAEVVARVDEQGVITFEDVRSYAEQRYLHQRYPDTSAAYAEALEMLVTEQLKLADFFASGMHRDEVLRQRIARTLTEELVLAYFETRYKDRYISEEAVRKAYEQMGEQVIYQQITLPKSTDAAPEEQEALASLVETLREQWAAGEDAEVLAGPFSEAAARGAVYGQGRPIGWQQSLANERNRIIFGLEPGDVQAFETNGSYRIVRVARRESMPVEPLEEVRPQLQRILRTRYLPGAIKAFEREKQTAVDTSAVRWHPEGLRQLVAWSHTSNFYGQHYREPLSQAIEAGINPVIMTYPGRQVDVAALLDLLDEVLIIRHRQPLDAETLKDFLLEAERTRILAERARALDLEEELLQPSTTSTILQSRLVRLYDQHMIEEQLPEPTAWALRVFYEAHDDSLFYQLARVNTEIIVRAEEDEIEAVRDELQQGVPFEEASHRRLIRVFERTRDGEIVNRSNQEPPYLGEVAFGLEEGETSDPVAYDDVEEGRRYAIVHATERLEERQLAFDEVRERVAEAFEEHHRARIAAEVAEDLREQYTVTLYPEVLEQEPASN